jgi:uncharacterized membrane protein
VGFSDWLLALHVLAAFSLVAALVLYTYLIVASRGLDVPSDVVRLFRISRVGDVLMAVGSIGVIVLGVWLAIDLDAYHVWDGWVIAAIVLWAILAEVGRRTGAEYNAARDRAVQLAAEGRDEPSAELGGMLRTQRGLVLHLVALGVALLILLDMIFKPGA